jgi:excisionase family DNA binding protein
MTTHLNTLRFEKRALSIKEASAQYGLSRAFLYKLMARGELQTAKIGARRIVARDALEALVIGDKKP